MIIALALDLSGFGVTSGIRATAGDLYTPQHDNKRNKPVDESLFSRVETVVDDRKKIEKNGGYDCADQYVRHSLSEFGMSPVGQFAEQRQEEQSEHIIRRHDDVCYVFTQMERTRKKEQNDIVV